MRDKHLPEEGLEKAVLQLKIIKQMLNNDITHLTGIPYDNKQYRKSIDRIFDKQEVKERFKNRKMYFQAMESYSKNNNEEVTVRLKHCLKIEELKFIINSDLFFPNLNNWWSYRNHDFYMGNILSDLIEIYIDHLIKGYKHYCCEYGMSCYSGCICDEIKYERH